jgi:membrane protease YdiL (CAAX protease family)
MLFARWLLKTSLGTKALADSVPRRNNMPVYLPFVPLFIWFGAVSLVISITEKLGGDLPGWQSDFVDNLIFCICGLTAIGVIIFMARVHFTRGLKGFGLNIKTVVKDFFAAFVNLLTVWPLITTAILLTMFFGKLIWGQDYQTQQHQELKLITENPQLPLRISIIVVAVVIAPLLEEMLFRGLFQTMLRSYLDSRFSILDTRRGSVKTWLAIAISSALFTTIHSNTGHWPALFLLGVCMGYAYEKSGSLFRPIFIHALFNAASIIAVLNQ